MTIVIMGKAASGKDTLQKELVNQGFERVVTATTREPREGEQNGTDYHFMAKDKFETMIDFDELVEYTSFNDAYYGCPKSSIDFEKDQCIILEPEGAQNFINAFGRDKLFVVYLQLDENIRKLRAEGRGSFSEEWWRDRCASDDRRFDKELFDSLTNYTLDMNTAMDFGVSPEETAQELAEALKAYESMGVLPDKHCVIRWHEGEYRREDRIIESEKEDMVL